MLQLRISQPEMPVYRTGGTLVYIHSTTVRVHSFSGLRPSAEFQLPTADAEPRGSAMALPSQSDGAGLPSRMETREPSELRVASVSLGK